MYGLLIIVALLVGGFALLNRPQFIPVDADIPVDFPVDTFSHRDFESLLKKYVDQDGNDIDVARLAVGDLIYSQITIQTTGANIHNIAIVDALCAGVEVENPSLATSSQEGLDKSGHKPDRTEFLDDRVLLFCR